jgi:hypothetical protein
MADPKNPYQAFNVATSERRSAADGKNENLLQTGAAALLSSGSNNSTFNIHRYPSDLGNLNTINQQPHYVMFYITVRESELGKNSGEKSSIQFDYSKNNTGILKNERTIDNAATIAQFAIGAAAGGAAGEVAGSFIGNKLGAPSLGANIGIAAGAIAGGATAASIDFNFGEGKNQVTLKEAIALYMSGKPSVEYQANWADEEIGIVGGLSDNIQQIKNVQDILNPNTLKSVSGAFSSYLLSQAMQKGNVGGLGNVGAAISAAAGVTPNPFRAQLFKSMGFRTFSYDYVFLPRNEAEYVNVQNIIYTFKRYMHPVLGSGKFVLNYPAEFTIGYYHQGSVNKELYKISNCALTKLSVEYGGTDFVTFKGTQGAPTEIAMKLEFTELEVLTRDRIEAGY